ncbi:MAG TPA: zinc-binding dehydrogenase [Roseiflexaceae bacterium]|nr:zinc-binding dehydrogenase [Roseiflexaceae bacterium]
MPSTQAVVIPAPNQVELREVELTPPGPDDVVVQVAYTSISAGTERMLLAGRMPHPMLSFPVVPGYETVGRVVGGGANVPPNLEGQWVYVGGARCYVGLNPAWGGQAATLIVDHRRVVPLEGVDPRQGVLLALAATALHGVDLLELRRAQRVLVLGQGPVGQIAARIARSRGHWVIASDRVASRLKLAVADLKIDSAEMPVADRVQEPVDVIVEATGSMDALAGALPLLAAGGTILLLGYYDELRLPYMPLFLKQARLLTAREWGPGDLLECRDLLAEGTLDLAGLITHRLPIAQIERAYQLGLNDPECLKLLLEWER